MNIFFHFKFIAADAVATTSTTVNDAATTRIQIYRVVTKHSHFTLSPSSFVQWLNLSNIIFFIISVRFSSTFNWNFCLAFHRVVGTCATQSRARAHTHTVAMR